MKLNILIIICLVTNGLQAQISQAWVATYNGQGDFNDRFTCMARTGTGEILLGGSTTSTDADRDFLVVKINASGEKVWQKIFNGPSSGIDEVKAIGVDAGGFTYLTGISKGISTSEDIWTIKLNANGDSLWSRRYDFVLEYDQPNALFIDPGGNVLVTGQSDGDPSAVLNDDYITIKYDPSGNTLWKKRFNGLGNATDRPVQVVADPFGNAIVTGRSDSGFNDDFVTIKYDTDGNIEWALYDDRGDRDRPAAMTVDQNGAIYITGRSSNGTDDDFWTLKYNGAGIQQWNIDYDYLDQDRPVAIAVDADGRIFVTGQSNNTNDWDFLTVAYSPAGNQIWEKRFENPAQGHDIPFAASVSGNTLYVTGQTDTDDTPKNTNAVITFAYNTVNGAEQWSRTYLSAADREDAPASITSYGSGCLVAGYAEADATGRRDALILAYQNNGDLAWTSTISGTGDNSDNIRALAVDAAGEIYAAGYSVGSNDNRNMALVHFGPDGGYNCAYSLDGDGTGSEDDGQALVLDQAGNPIIGGFTKNSGSSNDLTFFKLNNICDSIWTRKSDGGGYGSDRVYDMVAGSDGYFYATGRVDALEGIAANDNCVTLKLDADGNILWSKTHDSGSADRGIVIRQATDGSIYVLGRSLKADLSHDGFLIKYNNAGIQQWLKTYDFGGDDEPEGMEIAPDQRILIGGSSSSTATDTVYDISVIAYNSSGNLLWKKTYDRGGSDEVQAVAVSSSGDFYLAAKSSTSLAAISDMSVFKYDPSGNLVWERALPGSTTGNNIPDDINVNSDGLVFVTGHKNVGSLIAPSYDIVTGILNPEGTLLWTDTYNSPFNNSDIPNLLLVQDHSFFVAGSSVQDENQRDIVIIKYEVGLVDIYTPAPLTTVTISPNPFSGTLMIEIPADIQGSDIRLEVFNPLGEKVADRNLTASRQQIFFPQMPNGTYAYRIVTSNGILKSGTLIYHQ